MYSCPYHYVVIDCSCLPLVQGLGPFSALTPLLCSLSIAHRGVRVAIFTKRQVFRKAPQAIPGYFQQKRVSCLDILGLKCIRGLSKRRKKSLGGWSREISSYSTFFDRDRLFIAGKRSSQYWHLFLSLLTPKDNYLDVLWSTLLIF